MEIMIYTLETSKRTMPGIIGAQLMGGFIIIATNYSYH